MTFLLYGTPLNCDVLPIKFNKQKNQEFFFFPTSVTLQRSAMVEVLTTNILVLNSNTAEDFTIFTFSKKIETYLLVNHCKTLKKNLNRWGYFDYYNALLSTLIKTA